MKIKYKVVARDGKVEEAEHFENICCEEMQKAMFNQETPFAKTEMKSLWLYCPFCQQEIEY